MTWLSLWRRRRESKRLLREAGYGFRLSCETVGGVGGVFNTYDRCDYCREPVVQLTKQFTIKSPAGEAFARTEYLDLYVCLRCQCVSSHKDMCIPVDLKHFLKGDHP